MKKNFLSMMLIAVIIIFCSQFVIIENVYARNIYVGTTRDSDGLIDLYVDPDDFDAFAYDIDYFGVDVLLVWRNNNVKTIWGNNRHMITMSFSRFGDIWIFSRQFDDSNGSSIVTRSKIASTIFNIIYPKLEIAVAETERSFDMLIAKGDKFYNAKNYLNAENYYKKAKKLNESKVNEFCNNLVENGNRLYDKKNYEYAIDYYRKAIVMGCNYAEAYNNRGDCYKKLKNYDKAIEDYTQAIKIFDLDKDSYQNRGECYQALGRNDLAEKDFANAKAHDLILKF